MPRAETPASRRGLFGWQRLSIALALVGGAIALLYFQMRPPSDALLLRRFSKHRETFTRLSKMIRDEPEIRSIGPDNIGRFWRREGGWIDPDRRELGKLSEAQALERSSLTSERYQEYKRKLEQVGAYRITKGLGPHALGEIAIHIYRAGFAPSGTRKAIVYAESEMRPLVADTDDVARGPCYRGIEPNWYIETERN